MSKPAILAPRKDFMDRIPGTIAALSILTTVALAFGAVLIGGLWLLSTAVQHWLGAA